MIKARLITIGTEIVTGEVVNSNAAWVSTQLENLGVRVFSHLSVRDQRTEINRALQMSDDEKIVIVTGGLGPTSDDITRECMAEFAGVALDYDASVFQALTEMYRDRGLPLREAHKHQCHFPHGSTRLNNPVGTALGFAMEISGKSYFILPGPPRELEGMWKAEVAPRLTKVLPTTPYRWRRWTCLGCPESEVAELVEAALGGEDLEVGYRAAIPYVKVKVYVDPGQSAQAARVEAIAKALKPFVVAEETGDLAEEFLRSWPAKNLRVHDLLTENYLAVRLLKAQKDLGTAAPKLQLSLGAEPPSSEGDLVIRGEGQSIKVESRALGINETMELPYKTFAETDRGRRSAAEWALWICVRALRARSSQAST